MGVGDDQNVVVAVPVAQPRVQLVEQGRLLVRYPAAAGRVAEEHVVVPAERRPRRPLEAEDRRELAFDPVLLDQLLQLPPLAVVHPDVVLGEAQEVEPRHVAAEPVVAVRRALAFGEGGVAVGFAPVDAVRGGLLDADGIARRPDRSVLVPDGEAVDAGCGQAHVLEQRDGRTAGFDRAERLAVQQHLERGHDAGRQVLHPVLGADGEREGLARRNDRRRDGVDVADLVPAQHLERRPGRSQQVARAFDVGVEVQDHLVVGGFLQRESGSAPRRVAVGDGDRVAFLESRTAQTELQHGARDAGALRAGAVAEVHPQPVSPWFAGGQRRVRIRRFDRDVVPARRVFGLNAGPPRSTHQDAAALRHAERAHGVGQPDRHPVAGAEGTGRVERQRADCPRVFVLDLELPGVEADELRDSRHRNRRSATEPPECSVRIREKLREDVGDRPAGEGVGVRPLPQRVEPIAQDGDVFGGFRRLQLQRLDALAQVGGEVVARVAGGAAVGDAGQG